MSEKIVQGKAGIVATKKSEPVTVSNALLTDTQSKSGSNESLASEMETVIIRGTDFAKEFEKPNDRASHIKIGRAKQKIISGGQGSILQCTSVSGVASGNAGKPTATVQKTAAKPLEGPCRTSDLEGSAGNNSCAVKSALKKVTPTGTAPVTAPSKTGNVTSKAAVNVSSKSGNNANANKPNNMLSRPTPPPPPPAAVTGRPVEVAANIAHRPNFANMRATIQAPGSVFPGSVQPRSRGPGTNFNPQRPTNRMPTNLFNAGRPNVQVVNVRNPRPMTPPSGFSAVRPTLGITTRPAGPRPVRLASTCPVNKIDVRRPPNAANSTVRQRPLVPDKPSVKPCMNTRTKPAASKVNKVTSINDAVESSKKDADKQIPANKAAQHPTTIKTGCAGNIATPTKPTEGAIKPCNHATSKPVDNVSLGNDKSCAQGGNTSSSSSSTITSNTVKPTGKPVAANPSQSGSSQLFKVNSNTTAGNKIVKPTTSDGSETTIIIPQPNSSCDNVDAVLQNQPSAASEKEQSVPESTSTCNNSDTLDDVEGSKGGISFSFNRKMGQKLPSSVPFGKEEEKATNSVDVEKELKTEAVKEESCTEKTQESNKEMPSAGMSFLKVLNKEQTLELDWPEEMIHYTKTQPSISYSCNPLFFDFKELLSKDKCHKDEGVSSNQMKLKSDGDAGIVKTESSNADEEGKETKGQLNANDPKAEKVKKSRKRKHKLSSQRHTDEDEKSKKKKKKKHSSKKREIKSEGGISEKEEDKNMMDVSKNKRHKKKKKKRSHHSGPDMEQGHGEGGDGDEGGTKSKTSHKNKHKKHKSRKSKKKRHKQDEFEKESNSGHESEEDVAASAVTEQQKNKKHKKRKISQAGKDSSNFSSDDEHSKLQKAKSKVALGVTTGEKVMAATSGEPDIKLASVAVCEEDNDVSKKRHVVSNNPTPMLESIDESKKTKKDDDGAAKPGSCTERKRPTGEVDSPVSSKKKKLSSKNPCLKSEDTWSKMETIFEARSDPEGNKASWDTSSDSDVASHEKSNVKSKSADAAKRKKMTNPSQPSEKQENNRNPTSKTSGSTVKVEVKAETFHNSSGSDSDRPASAKQVYKRKKSYSGESHHSDSHCRSRDRSYSSSYSDQDSHYSDKSKHRHSRSHSSSRSRSRSRSASYERHSSRRGRRYSYSSYSDEDYRYRRGHSRSRSCSRRRSRTRSRSYSRSRRYRSYSSEHHRSYSSSTSRSRSRSESRGRSRSYSYSRSHSKSTSYSRSRSRSRSYHKSHSRSRSPHKSSKQDYRHKSSPERRYYSSKKNSKHVSGGKGENEKGGKLDPAKIPLPIMPGDAKEESGEGFEKSKDKKFPADTSKAATPTVAATGSEVIPNIHAVRKEAAVASGTGEPEAKSGLINIPLPPFQVAENAQLGKVDGVDGQLRPPPPPPHMLSLPHYPNTGDCLMHHPIPDLSQPPPSTSLMSNCPPPPPPPPPPMLNNNANIPGMPAARLGAPSLYGHLSIPPQDVPRMNAPPPPPPPKCGVDSSIRMQLPFTPRSVARLEQSCKENPSVSKSPIDPALQAPPSAATVDTAEKEMTPPLPPPKSPPPQPPPPPKKEDEKKNCEEISPMQPIIPPEQVEQYKHLQEMAQKHAMKQQRRQRLKDTGQAEESDDDESMEMEGQVSTMVSDEECEEQPGILALPEPEPQHLQQQILLPHAQHAGSPVIQHVVPFSQQQIIIPPTSLLQSQGAFPIQAGGPMIAIPHTAAAHHHPHHHHHHHPLAGHHALHHAFHPAAAGVPLAAAAAAAASHPFHHQLIAAAPGQLVPYSSPQPILTQLHPPGPIIIGHQVLIPRFPRAPM